MSKLLLGLAATAAVATTATEFSATPDCYTCTKVVNALPSATSTTELVSECQNMFDPLSCGFLYSHANSLVAARRAGLKSINACSVAGICPAELMVEEYNLSKKKKMNPKVKKALQATGKFAREVLKDVAIKAVMKLVFKAYEMPSEDLEEAVEAEAFQYTLTKKGDFKRRAKKVVKATGKFVREVAVDVGKEAAKKIIMKLIFKKYEMGTEDLEEAQEEFDVEAFQMGKSKFIDVVKDIGRTAKNAAIERAKQHARDAAANAVDKVVKKLFGKYEIDADEAMVEAMEMIDLVFDQISELADVQLAETDAMEMPNPFGRKVLDMANPFSPSPRKGKVLDMANPFAPKRLDMANPFAPKVLDMANPFAGRKLDMVNPFAEDVQEEGRQLDMSNPFSKGLDMSNPFSKGLDMGNPTEAYEVDNLTQKLKNFRRKRKFSRGLNSRYHKKTPFSGGR